MLRQPDNQPMKTARKQKQKITTEIFRHIIADCSETGKYPSTLSDVVSSLQRVAIAKYFVHSEDHSLIDPLRRRLQFQKLLDVMIKFSSMV